MVKSITLGKIKGARKCAGIFAWLVHWRGLISQGTFVPLWHQHLKWDSCVCRTDRANICRVLTDQQHTRNSVGVRAVACACASSCMGLSHRPFVAFGSPVISWPVFDLCIFSGGLIWTDLQTLLGGLSGMMWCMAWSQSCYKSFVVQFFWTGQSLWL